MCDNIGELSIFIAGFTVMIVMATSWSIPGQTDRFRQFGHNDSKFIIFSVMYFVLHDSMNYKNY